MRSVLLLMAPRLFAYGINTINTVVSTRFAAGLGDGERLPPLLREPAEGARPRRLRRLARDRILPLLSRQALAPDRGPFKDNLAFALRLIAFVTVPATVGLIVLQVPIVRVLFQGGRFGAPDTRETAGVLATLSAGLFFFAGDPRRRTGVLRPEEHDAAGRGGPRRLPSSSSCSVGS